MEHLSLTPDALEQLRAIRKNSDARRRYALMQTLALALIAAVVIVLAAVFAPRFASAAEELSGAALALQEADVPGLAAELSAFIEQGGATLDDAGSAIAKLEQVDLEGLNESIASLSAILEPLARLFGRN